MIERTQSETGRATRRRLSWLPPLGVLTIAVAVAAVGSGHQAALPILQPVPVVDGPVAFRGAVAEPGSQGPNLDILDPWHTNLAGKLSHWAWTAEAPAAAEAPPTTPFADVVAANGPSALDSEPPRAAMTVPLPVPRPLELRGSASVQRRAGRAPMREQAALPPQPAPEDNRNFLEKLFGVESPPARAYTALETKPADLNPRPRISPPLSPPMGEGGTATYDITARIVTLPNGERLEAHSGRGEIMDDPRYVNVRMRGATPPGTYQLTEREQLFHGVRAIRLTPVGGPEAVHGRVGLLAHTFMLGPSGASNGCVSFRDYGRFLDSYLRGEIRQLVVVAGSGGALPNLAGADGAIRLARN